MSVLELIGWTAVGFLALAAGDALVELIQLLINRN